MRFIGICGCALAILAAPVAAQAQEHRWAGFYVGAHAGGAWADVDHDLSTPGGAFPLFLPGDDVAIANTGSGSFSSRDFIVGVQAGYNYQMSNLVLGGEIDFGRFGVDESESNTAPTPFAGVQTTSTSVDADYLLTLRARLGYVMGQALLYATGGAAYAKIDLGETTSFTGVPTVDTVSESEGRWGWTIGGGAEYAFNSNWTLKAEYLYVDLGSFDTGSTATSPYGPPNTVPFDHDVDVTAHLARVGFNYNF